MRPALFAAVVTAVAALAAPALAGDPTGLWQTPTNGGQVRISRCGQALCGVLVTSATIRANPGELDVNNQDRSLRTRPLRNLPLLRGFTGGPTEWTGGSVYNPADGRTYRGTITMQGDNTLQLRGCVVAPLCRTQTWTRVP
ncbi:DUF2147 domain-containing protein [Brevundimonas lenta]|uniref:Uncharacterized protein (DUF2147 family) n=1 Tax=Brevundimonas lenta TaxID=424796 RepID=A0A7W6JFT1_9CAUL|nr:DUF2147 domain-containing protein [Brevundimonas lenta]MBB4083322.1 uncharacterized protein (DUF2147 family) [Brevundimonas lenta]